MILGTSLFQSTEYMPCRSSSRLDIVASSRVGGVTV